MDKVMSARIDESIVSLINYIAQERHMTKKQIIETSIQEFFNKLQSSGHSESIFSKSFGVWKRDESVDETIHQSKNAFNMSMLRHQKV